MASGAKVHKIRWWTQFQHLWRAWLPGTLLGLALLGGIIFGLIIGPQIYFRDIKDKSLQQGEGVISSISYGVTDQYGRTSPDMVFIKRDNAMVTYDYFTTTKRLQKGQHVHQLSCRKKRAYLWGGRKSGREGDTMIITLELAPEVENGLTETARRQGKTPEQLASETLRANFAPLPAEYPTAHQLLAMPASERSRLLNEAATHAAPLYTADLALPPEQRELTALTAIDDGFYEYSEEKEAHG